FLDFTIIFLVRGRQLLANKYVVSAAALFLFMIFGTVSNVALNGTSEFKDQLVFSVIHLQLLLAFVLGIYLFNKLKNSFVFQILLWTIFLLSFRLFTDDIENAFNLSSVRGLRVESFFAGGANNFALIVGVGFLINFFSEKRSLKKVILGFYFLIIIILTMSRGALFGLVFALFVTAVFDIERKTLSMLLKVSMFLALSIFLSILVFDELQMYFEKFSERFLGVFTGEATLTQASSGRGLIISDLYYNHLKHASLFQWLFGHGLGSISFMVNGYPYESSHNVIVDILFRNGILVLFFFMLLILAVFFNFLKKRGTVDLRVFSIFIFLHFELLVNPFIYAAQTGWIYTLFLALFISQKRLVKK
ncbi:MAG: O-antigen ligase family protein, partial [Cyanobacteria bacterium J06573_2]